MRRIHIGLTVDDLAAAVDFYTRLFEVPPTLLRNDYAKWMLDDPHVNFSVDTHADGPPGSAHFGVQVDSAEALATARDALDASDLHRSDQNDLVCGYQLQHKSWVTDPNGARWETFFTEGLADGGCYGTDAMPDDVGKPS
jgi:catechol 2,3-dioxygenase-like lactoylglutathione lyase family enzyme